MLLSQVTRRKANQRATLWLFGHQKIPCKQGIDFEELCLHNHVKWIEIAKAIIITKN